MARTIRIEGDVAYVPLTKGYEAVIDAADVPLVEGWNWTASVRRNSVYAFRSVWLFPGQKTLMLHRAVMGGAAGEVIDHIDGDGLNCRRQNLRHATYAQNNENRKKCVNNKSGFKGVSWARHAKKWQAHIGSNGTRYNLGYFDTVEEAATTYAKASAELHGEFGRLT